ncbi:tyrosine-type recombinase/integrase [Rhizobium pusense]|uniref:Integrase family protein n=3 Tax=Bacteria TaxID=2 RepID=A0A9W5EX79_9HYPH|nr:MULTISPECIES: tyrosine-type recombinase/integrase [Rhizobium/Agrobacterium group]MDH0908386.1 tyrosine-type recombinase/integrase [Agrobacterium pusense]MDH1094218.1 tyrosine-type recombinase/integrase [Agrobacterium pusense]MDH1110800.1 tyrosine-type recombinase/integrase [Agrobacterium pusense]MDH2192196.1 tyrosine-type recombinase/integrase [Agrobacterium pusense]CAD7043872.1 site-specific integrase [Rhizobium sp. P007]
MSRYAKKEYRVGDFWLGQRAGSPAWYRCFYEEASRRTKRASLGTDDFEEAKRRLDAWYMEQRMRTAQDLPPSEVTLKEVFQDYLDHHAIKLRSYESTKIVLRYWREFYGEKATVEHVRNVRKQEEFREHLLQKNLKVSSVNRVLEAGRTAINRAYKRNVISSVPFIQSLPREETPPKGRPLSVAEIRLLYTHAADHIRLFLILMLGTGARNEAICHLTWEQIDFEEGLIYLNPQGRKQTSKRRATVKLVPFVREVLDGMDKTTPYVIMWRGQGIDKAINGIRKAVGRAKMDRKVTAYSCRHTVARWLRREGVSPWEVGAQLGHRMPSFNITEIYASASPDYLEKSAAAIEKLLRAAIPLDAPPIPSAR